MRMRPDNPQMAAQALFYSPITVPKKNGAVGFAKGVGMGLTGFVLKDLAAIFGPLILV